MHQLAWLRLMVARHPLLYWLAIALLASVVALGAANAMARVDAARLSWGQQHMVWTATVAIEPGQPIGAESSEVPSAVVPIGAVDESPAGDVARQRIGPGEIITKADVAPAGSAALIPNRWVAFPVPTATAHFATGDHVAVYSTDQFVAAGLVVADGDSDVLVAIPAEAAPVMAAALLTGAVTLGLTPGP